MMKTQLLTFIALLIVVAITGCTSQKKAQTTTDPNVSNTMYTTDNTKSTKKAVKESAQPTELQPKKHIVQKGESLWVIAQKYGVSVKEIAEANNIEDTSRIKINQELIIPVTKAK